jgi:hypothetical protein
MHYAGGVHKLKRAAYKCELCSELAWQAPADFVKVDAWPATLSTAHLRTVVDFKLLQLYGSLKRVVPTISMSGFLRSVTEFAAMRGAGQVRVPVGS